MSDKKIGEAEILFRRKKCPQCGDERAVYRDTVEQELAAGRFGREMAEFGVGEITTGLIVDPTKNVLTAPQVTVVKDYCLGCGEQYVSLMFCVRVPVSIQTGPMPGGNQSKRQGFNFPPMNPPIGRG